MSSIWTAAGDGDCARLRALLETENVNACSNISRRTPLHVAADNGRADAVALLLEHGADVGLRSDGYSFRDEGSTPLHNAAFYGHPHCIALLLAAGADVNAKTTNSNTPLLNVGLNYTSRQRKLACASLLIQAGARVNDANDYGEKPIWAAINRGHRNLAKLLFRAGAVIPIRPGPLAATGITRILVDQVKARGGWNAYASNHKRVLVGLVTKCTGKPGFPGDAAGVVVEFWCPPGGF